MSFGENDIGEGRVKMLADMGAWFHHIKNRYDYSIDTKIHGSIMSILAGIPATVLTIDTRTKEMADFFNIPNAEYVKGKRVSLDDLQLLYENADYTAFNRLFKERYFAYERFLQEKRIVKKINRYNKFFNQVYSDEFDKYQPNREVFLEYARKLRLEEPVFHIVERILFK